MSNAARSRALSLLKKPLSPPHHTPNTEQYSHAAPWPATKCCCTRHATSLIHAALCPKATLYPHAALPESPPPTPCSLALLCPHAELLPTPLCPPSALPSENAALSTRALSTRYSARARGRAHARSSALLLLRQTLAHATHSGAPVASRATFGPLSLVPERALGTLPPQVYIVTTPSETEENPDSPYQRHEDNVKNPQASTNSFPDPSPLHRVALASTAVPAAPRVADMLGRIWAMRHRSHTPRPPGCTTPMILPLCVPRLPLPSSRPSRHHSYCGCGCYRCCRCAAAATAARLLPLPLPLSPPPPLLLRYHWPYCRSHCDYKHCYRSTYSCCSSSYRCDTTSIRV